MHTLDPTDTILFREKGFAYEAEEGAEPRARHHSLGSCEEAKLQLAVPLPASLKDACSLSARVAYSLLEVSSPTVVL